MREDINVKGADTESDFWLISILWLGCASLTISVYRSRLKPGHEFSTYVGDVIE